MQNKIETKSTRTKHLITKRNPNLPKRLKTTETKYEMKSNKMKSKLKRYWYFIVQMI